MADGGPDRKQVESLIKQANPQLLTNLTSTKRNQVLDAVAGVLQSVEVTQTVTHRSGPLPSPEEMIAYNTAAPGAADRILTMAEKQQDHRIRIESSVVPHQQRQSERGQIIGATLVVILIGAGVTVTFLGAWAVASVIFGTTILGVGSLYVAGKVVQGRELKRKAAN